MAQQCHVMRCTWQWCRARPAAKMHQLWSFKSCYVVPSWGLGKWKAAFLSTDSFYLVVVGAVRSSGCMIECIQLGLWTEDRDGLSWLEHHWLFPCSLMAPALWKQLSQKQLIYLAFKTPNDRHHAGTADETEAHSTWLLLFDKPHTHGWSSALWCQLLSLLRSSKAGSWCHVCKPPLCPQLL